MNLDEAHGDMKRLSELVDAGVQELGKQAHAYALAERDYRRAKARAWLEAPKGTVPEREAWVSGQTADLRYARDLAEGLKQAALEAVRSRRGQLSSWQSELAAYREEMGMARYGPDAA